LRGRPGWQTLEHRYKDICSAITSDQGGLDQLSEARLQPIRRFSASCVIAEQLESRLANGHEINTTEHALLCSTLARLGSRIGIDRRPRNVTPVLHECLESSDESP
jgi:hypothetical protein